MTPEAAVDLKLVSEQLTGHPVKYVVNSHYHNDHIGGNQVFAGAILISTEMTRELIAKFQPEEIREDKVSAPAQLAKIKGSNMEGMGPHELEENIMWTGYYEALAKFSDSLKVVLPELTFADSLMIHGTKRNVRLISYGKAHTESDLFLLVPEERIAFLGDLLFVENQPWLGDGDPVKWAAYLDRIARLFIKTLVPGHGPVGNRSNLNAMKSYFDRVRRDAMSYHEKGKLPEKDVNLKSPPPFEGWFLSRFYRPNVIWEYHHLYGK
jgi:glyoxylase-like metal-dependent hydrolase (beta-lactamase superfamily II)